MRVKLKRKNCHRSWNRGIALPVAIVVILVIATLALALILQSRTTSSLQKSGEKQLKRAGTASTVAGLMQQVFTGNDPEAFRQIGMEGSPPEPGGQVKTFSGKLNGVKFSGSFNGGDQAWSTYQPVPVSIDPKNFGFAGKGPKVYDPEKHPLPPNHSIVYVDVKPEDGQKKTYFYTFSNNSPQGILAPRGSISIREAMSWKDPSPQDKIQPEAGLKYYITAAKGIKVTEGLTGTARVYGKSRGNVDIGNGSTGTVEEEIPPIPPELIEQLLKELQAMMTQMEKASKDVGFAEFAMAIAAGQILFKGYELLDLGGFEFDGKTLIWNNSLILPKGFPPYYSHGHQDLRRPDSDGRLHAGGER